MKPLAPRIIELKPVDTPETAVAILGVQPRSIILLVGGFDRSLNPDVNSIFSRVIAPVAAEFQSLIIDDGMDPGPAASADLAAGDQDTPPSMLAIIRREHRALVSNHGFITRIPDEWPDRMRATVQITEQLTKVSPGPSTPVLAILFGGSEWHLPGVIGCVRRGWPILVFRGTGGVANEIAAAMSPSLDGSPPPLSRDPAIREIVETGHLVPVDLVGAIDTIERSIVSHLEIPVETLSGAWARYDDLDLAAVAKQRAHRSLQAAILSLWVVTTLLAILETVPAEWGLLLRRYSGGTLHILMLLAPITGSILIAANHRFRHGSAWIRLRTAAESIKREIFRYRARSGAYSDEQCIQISREVKLAAKVKDITASLAQSSEVNIAVSRERNIPERLTLLGAEGYVKERLEDQLFYTIHRTRWLNRQLRLMQYWILLAGGVGTLLVAINLDIWVTLTTLLMAVFTAKLETEQIENSLIQYNQALAGLRSVESWWKALTSWERSRRANVDLLVEQTEMVLTPEATGWAQQLQSALERQTEKITARLESTVERHVDRALRGPVMVNYEGFLCAAVYEESRLAMSESGLVLLRSKARALTIRLWLQPQSPASGVVTMFEPVSIRDGEDREEAVFEVQIDTDDIAFSQTKRSLQVKNGAISQRLDFSAIIDSPVPLAASISEESLKDDQSPVWIQLFQQNRLVQTIALRLRVPGQAV